MANVIEVVLKAVDQATDVIRGVADNTSSAGARMSMSFTELNSIMAIAGQVWGTVQKVAEQTVGAVVDYNKSILDLSLSLGVTTEEASRLVQVMDDFGISQGEVEAALKMMTKNGIQPTIANLAALSDEFNSINDPVERAQRMSQLLGRNWAVLTPVLSAGGKTIKGMAAEVSGSLVVTAEAAKQTEAYRLQVDQLSDAWTAAKQTIGLAAIPVLTDAMIGFQKLNMGARMQELTGLMTEHAAEVTTTAGNYEQFNEEMTRAATAALLHYDAEGKLYNNLGQVIGIIPALTESEFELSKLQNDTVTPSVQDMAAAYADVIQYYDPLLNGFGKMKEITPDLTDLMQGYTDKLLYNIAVQGLDADEAMDLAEQMGLVDQKTRLAYDATNIYKGMVDDGTISVGEYNIRLGLMKDALEGLDGKTFTSTYQLQMEVDASYEEWVNLNKNQGPKEQEAAGGTWTIPPGAGFEGFYLGAGHWASPGETVTVTPAGGQPGGSGGGGMIMNVYVGDGMDMEEVLFYVEQYMARR